MTNLLHCTTYDGHETFINVDSIRYIEALSKSTVICVGPEEYIGIDAPIEEVMNAIAEAMKESEGE